MAGSAAARGALCRAQWIRRAANAGPLRLIETERSQKAPVDLIGRKDERVREEVVILATSRLLPGDDGSVFAHDDVITGQHCLRLAFPAAGCEMREVRSADE